MDDRPTHERAIELLQQLDLKEYEAKSFVALARRQRGTARDISETSEVPRTRVYDAVRVLESKGLVEIQHSNPQVFRAVPIDEAVNTLRSEYDDRVQSLKDALAGLEPAEQEAAEEVTHEVWGLSGDRGITSRIQQLLEEAAEEVIMVIGHGSVFTDQLAAAIQAAQERGVTILLGTANADLQADIKEALPEVEVFVSGLDWLAQSPLSGDDTEVSRLLLVDREAILVSTFTAGTGDREHERGVFGRGFDNGLVALVRRLMATGLQLEDDPGDAAS